ncbi:MAG: NifU family protein [Fibrobacteres bacterium]|nr:NifU family protein [Fibrobacterota bacterium]
MAKVQKTSETPNPLAIRFHMDAKVVASGSRSYPDPESAQADPTANRLFAIPHVTSVFYVGTTVTVNKDEDGDWNEMITPIADVLEDSISPAPESAAPEEEAFDPYAAGAHIQRPEDFFQLTLEDQLAHLNLVMDEMVRPGLAGDGGGLELLGIEGTTVRIHYEGACGSCPSATSGTLMYIEGALQKKAHPELTVAAD